MKIGIVTVSLLVCLAVLGGASQAQLPELNAAGIALISPFEGEEQSFLAADVTFKLLPIEEPTRVSIAQPMTILQYIGANLGGDLLLRSKDEQLPSAMDNLTADIGASLPLLTNEGKLPWRVGLSYVTDVGSAWFLAGDMVVTRTEPTALAPRSEPTERFSYAVSPDVFMLTWTKEL